MKRPDIELYRNDYQAYCYSSVRDELLIYIDQLESKIAKIKESLETFEKEQYAFNYQPLIELATVED